MRIPRTQEGYNFRSLLQCFADGDCDLTYVVYRLGGKEEQGVLRQLVSDWLYEDTPPPTAGMPVKE